MNEKTILTEYVIGGKRGSNILTPNSVVNSMYLLTDMYNSVKFYYTEYHINTYSYINVNGIEFDGNIIFGSKSDKYLKINIDREYPIFDSMQVQNILVPTFGEGSWSYWQSISYINIVYKGVEYKIGNLENTSINIEKMDNSNTYKSYIYWSKPDEVKNQCAISGVGLSNCGLFCLQIIEAIKGKFDSDAISTFTYSRGDIGFIEAKIDDRTFKDSKQKSVLKSVFDECERNFYNLQVNFGDNIELQKSIKELFMETKVKLKLETFIMDYDLIGFENADTLLLLLNVYTRLRGWTGSDDVLYTYYPLFLSLLDKAIIDRDFQVIHSVNRLHRMLNRIIYNKDDKLYNILHKNDLYLKVNKKTTLLHGEENKALIIKLNKIWRCFVNTMEKCQMIHQSQISLNAYQVALLSNNLNHKIYAIITILCQISLIILIGINFASSKVDTMFPLIEGKIIIPVIFIFTCMIAYKQYTNTIDFRSIFTDIAYKPMAILDYFSNVICTVVIVIFNFFLLSFNNSVIDIVLNSIASLFIIELDDSAVFLSSDSLEDLFKQKLIEELWEDFRNIPKIYFNTSQNTTWKHIDYFRLDTDIYEINNDEIRIKQIV